MNKLSLKTINALLIIKDSGWNNTYSPRGLANLLWTEKLAECGGYQRRRGYARTAGCYYSKLMKLGLVKHRIDDVGNSTGYYISQDGLNALESYAEEQEEIAAYEKFNERTCKDEKGNFGIIEKVFKAKKFDLYKAKVLMENGGVKYYLLDELMVF